MGYTIVIGELKIIESPEDGIDSSCIKFTAEHQKHDKAPAFGEPTDYTNQRWPSYSVWSDFLRDAGLYESFFYDSRDLIGGHPGVRLITPDLIEAIQKSMAEFMNKNPGVYAGFAEGQSHTLARLTWLEYWCQWAILNCKIPVIANS